MKNLLQYLTGYKKESILGPLFKLLEASFELMVPLVMVKIIDIGIADQDSSYIIKMGAILILLGVIGCVCSITAQYFAAKAAVGFGTKLRTELFTHINALSHKELDKLGTSTLITRMTSDVNQVQSGVNLVLRLFLRSPFIVVGAMIMAFTISIKGALVFAVTIPLLSIVVFGIMILSIPIYRKVQSKLDKVLLITRENLSGARVIRAFNRADEEKEGFIESSEQLKIVQLFVGKISALLNPITYIIVNGAIVVLLFIGGKEVNTGILTQGQVIALVNYMSQILIELVKLANLIINITKSFACANRINAILEEKSDMQESSHSPKEKEGVKVEFCKVDFSYYMAKEESLSDISFQIQKGQTVGIIGSTGAGKSTLVHLLCRFYDVTNGSIYLDGVDIKQYPMKQLRQKIGIVPQKAVLFKGTIRENLKWGKEDATEKELYQALEIAQALEVVKQKEDGLDAMILQGGKNLSGGQKQRLTIARALVKQPEILILDDSASALDFATDAKLRKAIKEQAGAMTIFLVSQRATTIKQADQIIVLEDGKIEGIGTHQSLLESCEVYREICFSQLSKEEIRMENISNV